MILFMAIVQLSMLAIVLTIHIAMQAAVLPTVYACVMSLLMDFIELIVAVVVHVIQLIMGLFMMIDRAVRLHRRRIGYLVRVFVVINRSAGRRHRWSG